MFTGVFSVADAKTAGLWGKQGPWKQFPDRMLQMRARGFAARDGAADVLGGLYLREEVDETAAMKDVTPRETVTPGAKALPPTVGTDPTPDDAIEVVPDLPVDYGPDV